MEEGLTCALKVVRNIFALYGAVFVVAIGYIKWRFIRDGSIT